MPFKKRTFKNSFVFRKSVSPSVVALLMVAAGVAVHFFLHGPSNIQEIDPTISQCVQKIDEIRIQGFSLTKPLLIVDVPVENAEFARLKTRIKRIIDAQKDAGLVSEVSVYF